MTALKFEILLNEGFSTFNKDKTLSPVKNKNLISIINGFEDGAWRNKNFSQFIWNNIAESALSHEERESLVNDTHTALVEASKRLRLTDNAAEDKGFGSEIAEIFLYGFMRKHFNALPAVPKIFYKQNKNDNVKGMDSVHIVLNGGDDFSVWYGEAKFFNSIENVRLDAIAASVEDSLSTEKLKKENSIVTSVSDLAALINNTSLYEKIKNTLSNRETIDVFKPKLNVPILLIHSCDVTKEQKELSDEYKNKIVALHREKAEVYFKKQLAKCGAMHKYEEIRFHIILFPVPEKEPLVEQFIKSVKFYQGQ